MDHMLRRGLFLAFFVGFSSWANAEALNLPTTVDEAMGTDSSVQPAADEPTMDVASDVQMPIKGNSKDIVDKDFGHPKQAVAAVGQPPIERWIYDQFTVYFENQVVIHSVAHNQYEQSSR